MQAKRNLLLALFLITGTALLLSAFLNFRLDLTLLGLISAGLFLYLAIRFPECFLVAALFAPQWKTFWIFNSLGQFADLTVGMLLCLAVGLFWRTMMLFGRLGYREIRAVFSRQLSQILAFLVFASIATLSYFYTSAPNYGGSKLSRFLLIGTILLISPFFIIFTEDDFRRFVKLFIGFSAVTAIQMIGNLEMRSQGAADDISRIGAGWLMGMAILLMLFYPLVRNRRWQRALVLSLVPLFLVGLMASAARGPIVAMSVAVLLGVAIFVKEGRLQGTVAAILLFILVAGVGGAFLILRQTDLGKYSAKAGELKLLFTEGSASGTTAERMSFYRAALTAIPDHPLLGRGIGSWSTFYFGNDQRNYPHDLLLEIAFEEGLIGLTAFLALLFLVGISISQMLKTSRSHFLVLGLLVLYCVIVSLFSGDLDDNRVLWLWIGVTLAVCRFVQVRANALHSMQQDMRRAPVGTRCPPGVPAFSRHLASERYSIRKKDRAWREKFVF
jgi:O-antigen ligase